MKIVKYSALVVLLMVLLAACASLIPAQSFDNPLGLANKDIAVTVPATAALRTLAAGAGTVSGSFNDVDLSDVPLGIIPAKYEIELGFTGSATVSGSSLPATITLTNVQLAITVSDVDNSATIPTMSYPGSLTLTQQSGSSYSVAGSASIDSGDVSAIFTAVIASSQLTNLLDVILLDGSNTQNTAMATLSFETDDLAAGGTITMTINAGTGTVSF